MSERRRRGPGSAFAVLDRHDHRLAAVVMLTGVVGGLVGAAYLAVLRVVQHFLWPTHWSRGAHVVVLMAVGGAIALITRLVGRPGDVELLVDNIHVSGRTRDLRDLPSLIPVSLLGIGAGGGLGPEAPMVQTTGALGSWLATRWRMDRDDTRIVTITGMAAGFTVLFGAPLGSAVFALEILHRRGLEYYEALLPAVLGALSGYVVYLLVARVGIEPVFDFPAIGALRGGDLAWAVGCGILGAAIAAVFTYLNIALRRAAAFVPALVRPVLGGLGVGLLAFASPYGPTFGEAQLHDLAHDRRLTLTIGLLLAAAAVKLCTSAVTVASGWRGGYIIPLFFIGFCVGQALHLWLPGTNPWVLSTALMVATNVGVTKTPLGSTLVVTEMAGIALLPTSIVAAVVSLALTSGVGMIETQRRRGDLGEDAA